MTTVSWAVSILSIAVVLAVVGQHHRYLRTRRGVVAARQAVFHSPGLFRTAPTVPLLPHL